MPARSSPAAKLSTHHPLACQRWLARLRPRRRTLGHAECIHASDSPPVLARPHTNCFAPSFPTMHPRPSVKLPLFSSMPSSAWKKHNSCV
ncbi:hypothetical protein K438DRAFT_2019037 [Mycena galopus ATCC 62051]|nr:hypothetical protein K438DRAFT_2019037 [Mycena galopus ATCC 62051]